jgi:two-component sensor histidine kinase
LFYLYALGPLLTAPMLVPGFFAMDRKSQLVHVLGSAMPFLGIPAVLHSLYAWAIPPVFARFGLGRGPLPLHAALGAAVAVSVGLVVSRFDQACHPKGAPLAPWLLTCIAFTWSFLLPTLLMKGLRERAHEAEHRMLEEQKAALKAQIEAIQSRTNPHFLFNALNTIASLIPEDPRLAEATLERLADLLRYALENAQQEQVSLEREIAMLTDYLEVQKARFGSRLAFSLEVEEQLRDLRIPPLLLQPLVENAVLHGVAGSRRGGSVTLRARRGPNAVEIRIDDDGPGPGGSAHKGSGTSLADLGRRIMLVYGPLARLVTERNESGGFSARIEIPLPSP